MQATFFPARTLHELDQVCNNFLWGDEENKRKLHLVGKETTFRPKIEGGLGIRNQKLMNKAFMAKLGWKLAQGPPNLAQKCIMSKYIHDHKVTPFANGSPVWRSIGRGWDILDKHGEWILGTGEDISFWHDDWLNIGTIRSKVQGPLNLVEDHRKVSTLVENGQWNLGDLSIYLTQEVIDRIKSLPPPR